ncbi:MAG TPA: AAA family ATPase, partial [Nodosilinea sp.]|nr:AAA family ATPase [Nodosilinea sp.]
MNDFFKGFEQLLELAKTLEEKAENGELKTNVQINARGLSSIPRQGNIPDIGVSRMNRNASPADLGPDPAIEEVIITPPPAADGSPPSPSPSPSPASPSPSSPPPASPPHHPTMRDVGGLSATLQELRELVEIPLKRPDVLAKLGLEPTRGVLLVGPPGTGKTLTARSLAEDLGVNYIAIVGPEVMGKYYGEAEQRLRAIFEKAKKAAPCLVFIDEIDSLAPDRSKVEG